MANNKIYVKRTSTSGNIPTTAQIANGELAVNMTDGILYSTNGSVVFAIGANLVNQRITGGANAIILSNATQNWFWWNTVGVAIPSVTTRSAGTKLALYPSLSGTQVDYAIGIESNHMWFSTDNATTGCKWYANTTNYMTSNVAGLYHTGVVNAVSHTSGAAYGGATAGMSSNATIIGISSNTTVNSSVSSSQIQVANSTSIANLNAISLTIGTSVVNSTVLAAGANVYANVTTLFTGNSTVNASMISSLVRVANSTGGANVTATNIVVGNATVQTSISIATAAFGGNVAVNATDTATYNLFVNGSFAATTKSFVIDHPSKKGMKLRHGSLEGPENGVYVRGRTNTNIIELPDYWVKLVDKDSITVSLTAIGKTVCPSVGKITNKKINLIGDNIDCFFHVFAERKDVEKLVVEY